MLVEPKEIENTLSCLLGLSLSDMWRAGGEQWFEFGEQKPFINRRGEEAFRADYSLIVGCVWRIISPSGVLVGADDYGPGSERRDSQAHEFFDSLISSPPMVQSLSANTIGDLHIEMTGGYSLDVFIVEAVSDDQWWFMLPEKSYCVSDEGFVAVSGTRSEHTKGSSNADNRQHDSPAEDPDREITS